MKTFLSKLSYLVGFSSLLFLCTSCSSCKTSGTTEDSGPPTAIPRGSSNVHQVNYADLAVCDGFQVQDWNYIHDVKHGLYGYREDEQGGFVGAPSLRKQYLGFININNWFPLWPQKVSCCGQFHHFKTHNKGDENDWNLFVIPDQHSRFIIDFALPHRGNSHFNSGKGAKWSTCITDGDCVEAEITAIENRVINSILSRNLKEDNFVPSMVGDNICVYGTAVREYVHNNRPEIHPAEIIWWSKPAEPDIHHVMVVQDASKRFGKKNRYKNVNNEPGPWQPWAQAPITSILKIPFEFEASETDTITFHLYEETSAYVEPSDASTNDPTDNPMTVLKLDRNDRIIVHEHQNRDEDIGISFVDICRQAGDRITGFLNISINIGAGTNEKQGVFYLRIEKNKSQPAILPTMASFRQPRLNPALDSTLKFEVKSIFPKKINGKLTLTASITTQSPTPFSLNPNDLARPMLLDGRQLSKEEIRSLKADSIKNMWLMNTTTFTPVVSDFSLIPLEEYLRKKRTEATPEAASIFKKYVGGKQLDDEYIKQNKLIELSTYPYYCVTEEGDCNLEESSSVLDSLNEWANNPENLLSYGNEWEITATNVFTNERVPIKFGSSQPSNAPIWIEYLSNKFNSNGIRIHFLGAPNTVYRVTAIVNMFDEFSNQGRQTFTFLSHEIVKQQISLVDSPDLLIDMVEGLGISYDDNFKSRWEKRMNGSTALIKPRQSIVPDLKEMAYQATLNYYIQILDDGTITEQELDGLEKSIRLTEEF